jgi:Ca2+:H+ antiporter
MMTAMRLFHLLPVLLFPLAVVLGLVHAPAAVVFLAAALAIVPLASLMGLATEELAARTGPTVGGLMNATLGNAAEVIIAVFALKAGLIDLVKASLTGSIIGNLLLILGLSLFVGGLRYQTQSFSRQNAGMNASLLALATVGLVVPALFDATHPAGDPIVLGRLSEAVAVVLMLVYLLSLLFSLKTHRSLFRPAGDHEPPRWSMRRAITMLVVATVLVAWLSEILVGATEETIATLGVSEFFLGIIIIPLVGNAAEHGAAVMMAAKNKMDLSFSIAVGSSTQVALFVAPLLVFVSLILGNPMDLAFNAFEVVAVALGVGVVTVISLDGESNWLEGAQLLAVYVILAAAFFFF